MALLKRNKDRVVTKSISFTRKDEEIVNEKLNHHGDLTGFVRFCLSKPELIEEFLAQ